MKSVVHMVYFAAAALILSLPLKIAATSTSQDSLNMMRMDSIDAHLPEIEQKVRSTLMFGGSSPVSFSGEGRIKLQYHNMPYSPAFVQQDKTYIATGYEGNESLLRLGMVVRAGRNTVLWSKIGFQSTMPGHYNNGMADSAEWQREQTIHDKADNTSTIHEDMSAGIAIRTVPASFWLKMGNIQWLEASPLTIWKSQPRTFAWEYLPFEIEQPIGRYYEYNIAKGEKTGRAAWNKKAFNGISLESINLPLGLYANVFYGSYERYDNFEREYLDFSNDVAYAGDAPPLKAIGIGETYRHIFHARVAAEQAIGNMTPGLNFLYLNYNEDILENQIYKNKFNLTTGGKYSFYKQPIIGSVDLKGNVTDKLWMHLDVGFSRLDTSYFLYKKVVGLDTIPRVKETRVSPLGNAVYTRINSEYTLPIQLDLAYISPDYYSPFSFAMPADCFFPFGANLLGSGKFVSATEASPYAKNMMGANMTIAPKLPGYGHFKIIYGQHAQITPAQDVIFFPYRLNGTDMFSMYQSSYNRWNNDLLDVSMAGVTRHKYDRRLGDESFNYIANLSPQGPYAGGLRSGYLGMFEGFVPYTSTAQADSNLNEYQNTPAHSDVLTKSKFVPQHQKYTFNLELDGSYDVGPYLGYKRDLFVAIYAAINGVSQKFVPLAFDEKGKDMFLWGSYFRCEPAIALTEKFYVLGLIGYENWRSQMTYMQEPAQNTYKGVSPGVKKISLKMPMNFEDIAFGIGFDWEFLSRTGLHTRLKWMKHSDVAFPSNNWETPVVSTEIKMWF